MLGGSDSRRIIEDSALELMESVMSSLFFAWLWDTSMHMCTEEQVFGGHLPFVVDVRRHVVVNVISTPLHQRRGNIH